MFDKVEENTHGFQHTTRRTFAEQANLAINQTFMRSINTSLISVLPILALMVVAVWLLGVGTLKDLALVQLVGIMVGTYSSIFFATPLLVTLRERTELVRTHTRRVVNRRSPGARGSTETGAAGETAKSAGKSAEKEREPAKSSSDESADETAQESARIQSRPRRPVRRRQPTSRRRARGRSGPPVPGVRPASETPAGGSRVTATRCRRIGFRRTFQWIPMCVALAVGALAAASTLTACSGGAASQIDYVVDGALSTYNTNTVVGAASAGAQAFARTLTGSATTVRTARSSPTTTSEPSRWSGGAPLVLDYQIADNAVYSDGKPVTCDDMVLAWAAQSGQFRGFDAASTQAGLRRHRQHRLHAGAEEGPGVVHPGPRRRRLQRSCSPRPR